MGLGERIRVMRIIGRLNIGGPAIHVVNLNGGLDPDRYDSLLATGREGAREGSMTDFAAARGLRLKVIPELGREISIARDLTAVFRLYRLMRKERPHIVHTHTAKAGFAGRLAARFAGVPVVCHTFHGHVLEGYFGPGKPRLFRGIERILSRLTDRIITISETLREDLSRMGVARRDRISVVPLGFNLDGFRSCRNRFDRERRNRTPEGGRLCNGRFRKELGITEDQRLVAAVGRLVKIKNIPLFIDAARMARASDPQMRFVLVGDGELRPVLEDHVRSAGLEHAIRFAGWRYDMEEIYSALDTVVISSDNEGTPVSLIEAMAAGCPVVATRVGGVPDLLEGGSLGRMTPRGDARALAEAMLDVFRDEAKTLEMAVRARRTVLDRYRIERLIADMDRLYTGLLGTKRKIHRSTVE